MVDGPGRSVAGSRSLYVLLSERVLGLEEHRLAFPLSHPNDINDGATYLKSWYKIDVSMVFFHPLSILLFAFLTWNATTEGTFQEVLKVRASSVLTGHTKKSLNKCHWLWLGASASA